jgi:hypothetical protein
VPISSLNLRVGQIGWLHAGTEKPDRSAPPSLYLPFLGQHAYTLLEEPFELSALIPTFGLIQGTQMVKHPPECDRPPKLAEVIEYDIIQRIMVHPVVFLTAEGSHELVEFSFLGRLALDVNFGWFNKYHATNYSLLVANRGFLVTFGPETRAVIKSEAIIPIATKSSCHMLKNKVTGYTRPTRHPSCIVTQGAAVRTRSTCPSRHSQAP